MITDQDYALEALLPFGTYQRQATVFKESQLDKKVPMDTKYLLPKNVMVHLMPNLWHTRESSTFNVNEFPFLTNKSNLMYIKHIVDFDILGKHYRKLFPARIRRSNLRAELVGFDRIHKSLMVPVRKYTKLVNNFNAVLISNYNPLYRVTTSSSNILHHMDRFITLFSGILREIGRYNRNHIIPVVVPDNIRYDHQSLIALNTLGKFEKTRISGASPDYYFDFFFLHLGLLLEDSIKELSVFKKIHDNSLRLVNVMFIKGDKSITANLYSLLEICDSKSKVKRFLSGIVDLSKVASNPSHSPTLKGATELEKSNEGPSSTTTHGDKSVSSEAAKAESEKTSNLPREVVTSSLFESESIDDDIDHDTVYIPSDLVEETPQDTIDVKLEKDAEEFLKDQDLTPKQKERVMTKLMGKHKTIKLSNGKTMNEIMTENIDTSVKPMEFSAVADKMANPKMATSTTIRFDQNYIDKQMPKDIVSSLVSFQSNGMFVTAMEEEDEINSFTRVRHNKVSFEDVGGKKHTIHFKYPVPDKDGYLLVDGVKLAMTKQMVNVPICKVSPTRVSLISNYNKTLVNKVTSNAYSLAAQIGKHSEKLGITTISVDQGFEGLDLPYEYKHMGGSYGVVTTKKAMLCFDYHHRFTILKLDDNKKMAKLEKEHGVLCGRTVKDMSVYMFMDSNNRITEITVSTGSVVSTSNRVVDYLGEEFRIPYEWCNLKILDKDIPVIFTLAYRFGLSHVLQYLRVNYRFVPSNSRLDKKPTEMSFRFKDGTLIVDRYPLVVSLIISGLKHYSSIKLYSFDQMDDRDTYYQLLYDKGISTNYLKGIDSHFMFFIDPITFSILVEMGEPTNTKDLLIRAVEMIVHSVDEEPASMKNFRVRSYEKIPATLYNEISRQYANYVNNDFKEKSFSINTEAVYQRIIQDQCINVRDEINPVNSIKSANKITYTGFGGRTAESFVERDRKFPADAKGILSEATVDSGAVALAAYLSPNAPIKNLRGTFEIPDKDELDGTNSLSVVSQLMPFITSDD